MARPVIEVKSGGVRGYTNGLLDAIDEGLVSKDDLINDLLCYLSESDVEDFVQKNYRFRDDDNECMIRVPDEDELEETV